MSNLATATNDRSAELFGALTEDTSTAVLDGADPILATPAAAWAAAAGVTATAAAFAAGFFAEEATDR